MLTRYKQQFNDKINAILTYAILANIPYLLEERTEDYGYGPKIIGDTILFQNEKSNIEIIIENKEIRIYIFSRDHNGQIELLEKLRSKNIYSHKQIDTIYNKIIKHMSIFL